MVAMAKFSQAQQLYRMKMNVKEIYLDTTYCTSDTTVIWGIKGDTICFAFVDKVRCYYEMSAGDWNKVDKKTRDRLQQYVGALSIYKDDLTMIVQDRLKEKYSLRVITDREHGALLIFLSNLETRGIPSYIMAFGCCKCE